MAGCGGLGTAVALAGCGLLSQGVTITAPAVMTVSSAAVERGELPSRFTCEGSKVLSPPINWSGEPKGTQSIAIVVDDADAPISPYVYWIVFDIQPGTAGDRGGAAADGSEAGQGQRRVRPLRPALPRFARRTATGSPCTLSTAC